MKFYDCKTAPSPRRSRIVIAEKGVEVETVEVDLAGGEQFSDWFRAVNPGCTVPVLELDDGRTICEAVAVNRYLEEAYPKPPLMGRDPAEKAVIAMWDHRVEFEGFLALAEILRNSHPRFARNALPGPLELEQIPALAERGKKRLGAFFDMLDKRLGDSAHVAGETFSIADITALIAVDFARRLKAGPPEGYGHIARWYDAVSQRPSVQA